MKGKVTVVFCMSLVFYEVNQALGRAKLRKNSGLETMGIRYAQRVAIIQRIVYVENMIAVIKLEAVVRIEAVIASGGEPDFIDFQIPSMPRIVEWFSIDEGSRSRMPYLIRHH